MYEHLTLFEVANKLRTSLIIRSLKQNKGTKIWQVKLEKISFKSEKYAEWATVRAETPNAGIDKLCEKLSYRICHKGNPKYDWPMGYGTYLGLVTKGNLCFRIEE